MNALWMFRLNLELMLIYLLKYNDYGPTFLNTEKTESGLM